MPTGKDWTCDLNCISARPAAASEKHSLIFTAHVFWPGTRRPPASGVTPPVTRLTEEGVRMLYRVVCRTRRSLRGCMLPHSRPDRHRTGWSPRLYFLCVQTGGVARLRHRYGTFLPDSEGRRGAFCYTVGCWPGLRTGRFFEDRTDEIPCIPLPPLAVHRLRHHAGAGCPARIRADHAVGHLAGSCRNPRLRGPALASAYPVSHLHQRHRRHQQPGTCRFRSLNADCHCHHCGRNGSITVNTSTPVPCRGLRSACAHTRPDTLRSSGVRSAP